MSESLSSVKSYLSVCTTSVSIVELFVMNVHSISFGVTEGTAEMLKVIVMLNPFNVVIGEEGPIAETLGATA